MRCPQKRRFAAHWSMVKDGAIPAGLFGRYMTRDRCHNIMHDLLFVDNTADQGHDKLWKLRAVVDKIQQHFLEGWPFSAVFSFDECVLPATSRRNTTRMFMSDKPHRYGSKLFMLCDAMTAYFHIYFFFMSFEVYVGKRRGADDSGNDVDYKTGAAAVVRNLKVALTAERRHSLHAVLIDRYYSSLFLAIKLLNMNTYVVGTIVTNRLGFDQSI
ncbi:Hypothetical protein PHPALM_14008 [Phytophthora palmivora]|uniref:PiggyBac transposable element-derived protein domain-containing protein n=1 Tax=Phytophthora palmivora TaxID=4796 RepID=A0A2P4XW44_9STRA|nr:Hypothetical protein PHPALM_14008 [Phytophthora palmivora]